MGSCNHSLHSWITKVGAVIASPPETLHNTPSTNNGHSDCQEALQYVTIGYLQAHLSSLPTPCAARLRHTIMSFIVCRPATKSGVDTRDRIGHTGRRHHRLARHFSGLCTGGPSPGGPINSLKPSLSREFVPGSNVRFRSNKMAEANLRVACNANIERLEGGGIG